MKAFFNFLRLLLVFLHVLQPQSLSEKAQVFAFWAHIRVNQFYGGWRPYYYHLRMAVKVAERFMPVGISETQRQIILAATWLHDTIEDCRLTYNDLKTVFGVEVADIVYAVTNEKGKNRKQRAGATYYKGIRETLWATYVKLCDRTANATFSILQNSPQLKMHKSEKPNFMLSLSPIPNECVDLANNLETLLGYPGTWVKIA